jgi:hypothetical protein
MRARKACAFAVVLAFFLQGNQAFAFGLFRRHHHSSTPNPATQFRPIGISTCVAGATVSLDGGGLSTPLTAMADSNGYAGFPSISYAVTAANLHIRVSGYDDYDTTIPIPTTPTANHDYFIGDCGAPLTNPGEQIQLPPMVVTVLPMPPVPSRDQVLSVRITFQGLSVTTQAYGTLPWFEAALVSLSADDRQAVYAAKKAAGDTHCIVSYAWSYDEPGQPYANIPGANFTGNDAAFATIVEEVIREGFTPMIFMGGDGNYDEAVRELPNIVSALQNNPDGDLNPYVIYIPGWDSVFYGYTPDQLAAFGNQFRSLLPNGYLGVEHNTGHIPAGNGPADYAPGGTMADYDLILSEFDGWLPGGTPGDSVWQVAGRLLGPAYRRPGDQPPGDDPNPPFYLASGSARGPYYTIAFEYDEYRWVRNYVTADQVQQEREYFISLGYQWGDTGLGTHGTAMRYAMAPQGLPGLAPTTPDPSVSIPNITPPVHRSPLANSDPPWSYPNLPGPVSLGSTYTPGSLNLDAGQSISVQGVQLAYQDDGNLVIYNSSGQALWASNTSGRFCTATTCQASFQGDGNLVLYENGVAYWASNTAGEGAAQLHLSAIVPFLEIETPAGVALWMSAANN